MQAYEKFKEKFGRRWSLDTISSKIILSGFVIAIIVAFFVSFVVSGTITSLEERLIVSRLEADINYAKDLVSHNNNEAKWNVKDNTIYFGETMIGDGTKEKANLEPFLEHFEKTGTLAYIFVKISDEDPDFKAAQGQKLAYEVGHYRRAAGST